jgi:HK97 family phage prohead protease
MANDKRKQQQDNRVERRFFQLPVEIEQREGQKQSRKVVGYAAVFNRWSSPILGWFREKIDEHAFDNVLNQDTVALFNHDKNLVLARNNKTLKLSVDSTGLRYEFEAPNTTAGNDLLENIRLGNIKSSSFAFTVKRVEWEKNTDSNVDVEENRTILEVENLIDVSPVTFPAYHDATVASREYQEYCSHQRKEPEEEQTHEPVSDFEILKEKVKLIKHSI